MIVPLVGIAVVQASGAVLFGAIGYAITAAVVLLVSAIGLRVGVQLFGRETILTRWR